MTSSEELQVFFDQVKVEVDDREPTYGDCWKGEEMSWLLQNIFRKANAVKYMVENGSMGSPKFKEQLRDLAAYSGFVSRRLEV